MTATSDQTESRSRIISTPGGLALGLLRLIIGWTFLWAFLDKLFALGYSTGRNPDTGKVDYFGDAAFIHGASPTYGYLTFGSKGPFKDFYTNIAGETWADWGFMFGLAAIGVSFTLGIFMRLGTIAGVVMYVLMWSVYLPPDSNPVTDEHLLGAAAVLVCGLLGAGRYIGLGRWWTSLPIVRRISIIA